MSNNSEGVKNWRKNTKLKIIKCMGDSCQICGYDKCYAALELHHLDPNEKEISLGGIRASPKSWDETIVPELKKCVLLCSNCHRELHNGITTLPVGYKVFNDDFLKEIKEEKMKKLICPNCGNPKDVGAKTCESCYHLGRQLFSDEKVIELFNQGLSFTKIGKELGVSDNGARKRLKRLGLV